MNNDLISREALKKALRSECRKCKNIYMFECLTHLLNITDNAPTVEERPTGEWIFDGEWRCSMCDQTPWYNKNPMESGYKFCPNCGAKMEES